MKGRGAREARKNFCGAHFNFSTDCTFKGAGDWKLRQSTPINERHSVTFCRVSRLLTNCSLMDLNGCVVACTRFPLLYEPIKIYHHTPADDLLQAVNSIIQHNIRARKFFCTHTPNLSTDCTCRGIRNGGNHNQ